MRIAGSIGANSIQRNIHNKGKYEQVSKSLKMDGKNVLTGL